MLDDLTGQDIASEVKLCRDTFSGTILIVEGQSDYLLFGRFVDTRQCQIIPSYGKENSISAIAILDSESFKGILAIIDADFWNVLGWPVNSPNLLVTEFHDVEVMIYHSKAFYSVLNELGTSSKISSFLDSIGVTDIRNVVFLRALPIGTLRFISSRDNLNLTFKGLPYKKIIDRDTLKIDIQKLVKTVLALSRTTGTNHIDLLQLLVDELANTTDCLLQICCGHDVTAIVCTGLKKALGSQQSKAVLEENVEAIFRLAYDSSDFKTTKLYLDSKVWEGSNPPYRVFNI